jgi:predicted branched-subunit amino acid permease
VSSVSGGESGFTFNGLRQGALAGLPLGAAGLPYGMVYAVLAAQAGLLPTETIATSVVIYSGSAQFAALELWSRPPVLAVLVFAVLAMNARYLLYGALLRPQLRHDAPVANYVALFLLGDANWAMMMHRSRAGPLDSGFGVGSGLVMFAGWVGGSILGVLAGDLPPDVAALGLDFLLPAFFATMLASLWRGRSDMAPLVAAVAAAFAAHELGAGGIAVIAGGLSGAIVAGWRHGR